MQEHALVPRSVPTLKKYLVTIASLQESITTQKETLLQRISQAKGPLKIIPRMISLKFLPKSLWSRQNLAKEVSAELPTLTQKTILRKKEGTQMNTNESLIELIFKHYSQDLHLRKLHPLNGQLRVHRLKNMIILTFLSCSSKSLQPR